MNEFEFERARLDDSRKPGISAYMRIKNEAEFLRLAVESHLPFYDEIVCVYNNCSDATPDILAGLQNRHPNKIKVFHYLPKVHPPVTEAHDNCADDDVHGLANYYNYTLAKCSYSVAVKLDADHLAIQNNLTVAVERIRAEIKSESVANKVYTFSGINLMRDGDDVGVNANLPFSGTGDIFYHPVSSEFYYVNAKKWEILVTPKDIRKEYLGILYFHLKYLKANSGFDNANAKRYYENMIEQLKYRHAKPVVSFDKFASRKFRRQLTKNFTLNTKIRCFLYRSRMLRKIRRAMKRRSLSTPIQRFLMLDRDLQDIDFHRDIIQRLQK